MTTFIYLMTHSMHVFWEVFLLTNSGYLTDRHVNSYGSPVRLTYCSLAYRHRRNFLWVAHIFRFLFLFHHYNFYMTRYHLGKWSFMIFVVLSLIGKLPFCRIHFGRDVPPSRYMCANQSLTWSIPGCTGDIFCTCHMQESNWEWPHISWTLAPLCHSAPK